MGAQHRELASRSRIIAAARHLFSTRGFHQTAIADLAEEANVSVGLIYRQFKGKSDIILAIVQENTDERIRAMSELRDRVNDGVLTIEEGLTELAMLALCEGDEALSFEILAEAHRNREVALAVSGLCGRYRAALRDIAVVAHRRIPEAKLDAAEELLLACMFGLGHSNISAPRLSAIQTAEQTARMILAALRSLGDGDARLNT